MFAEITDGASGRFDGALGAWRTAAREPLEEGQAVCIGERFEVRGKALIVCSTVRDVSNYDVMESEAQAKTAPESLVWTATEQVLAQDRQLILAKCPP